MAAHLQPTIARRMSRDKRYQRLLNDRRWQEVKRIVWQRAGGLCERCRREGISAGVLPDGYITPGVDCHHIQPVESAKTEQEMKRLAYDVGNIQLLCIPCHIKTHQEMRSHTKEAVKANKERARKRFMEANDPNYKPTNKQDNEHDSGRSERATEAARRPVNEEPDNGEKSPRHHSQGA